MRQRLQMTISRWAAPGLFLLLMQSCGKNDVDIFLQSGSEYPVVRISNTAGPDVVLNEVSTDKGSIGFESDGRVTWLKGEPKVRVKGDPAKSDPETYLWELSSGGVAILQITPDGEDLLFNLSLQETSAVPTRWFVNLAASEDEYFTGIFERVVDGRQDRSWAEGIAAGMNLHGQQVEMKVRPTVSAYSPFYVCSGNYGLFVHGTWPGSFDFCSDDAGSVQIAFEGGELSFKLYRGTTPADIVRRHALETGPSIVPPEWAMGPWRWRDEHVNRETYFDGTKVRAPYNSELVEDVLMMQAYDIPLTAYWIDRPWAPGVRGFDDYEFDPERFPKHMEMIEWLNGKNIELMMWIAPFVMGHMADYAEEHNYNLKSNVWRGSRQVLMDFTNAEAARWWGENGPGKLARMGIKGFKMDRADGEKLLDSLSLKTSIGTSYRENYNDYPWQYVKAAYDAVKPVLGDDFLLFPRAQFTGSAKYGGMWAGDTNGRPEGLRSAIIAMQRCAIMGYPIWGSDTGGYWGQFSHETCMRWLAFSCFSPLMEVGPTNNEGFWNNPDEPHYDTPLIATWRLYSKTRMKLMPYVRSLAVEASNSGMPVARPLFLMYPEQQEAWNDWQTYMFGPDILVSAIWQQGKDKHRLYLPADEEWIDAWNPAEIHAGGDYVEVDAPSHKLPIFIRKGATIDLGDLNALYEESLTIAARKPDLRELEKSEGWR